MLLLTLLISPSLCDINKNLETLEKKLENISVNKSIKRFGSLGKDSEPKQSENSNSQKKYYIKKIVFVKEIVPKELEGKLQKYTRKWLSINDIYNIISIVNNYYLEKGYSTTLVNLEQIDIEQGELIFKIYHGLVNKIYINKKLDTLKAKFSVPMKTGDKFNIIRLDQAVENIRNSSYELSATVVPSNKPGYSDIFLSEKHKTFDVGLSVDSSGNDGNGFLNSTVNLTVNDPMSVSDTLSFIQNHRFLNQEYNSENTYIISYNLPYRFFALNYSFQYAYSKYLIEGDLDNYYNRNRVMSHNVSLHRYIFRDSNSKGILYVGYNKRETLNKIDDIILNSSSYASEGLNLGINILKLYSGGYFYVDFKYNKGLSRENKVTSSSNDSIYDKYYDIFKLTLISERYIYTGEQIGLKLNTNIGAMYTPNYLLSTNKFYVGDAYSVRSMNLNSVMWDYGFYAKNDIVIEPGNFGNFFVGLDFGHGRDRELPYNDTVAGIAAGCAFKTKHFSTNIFLAKTVYSSKNVEKEDLVLYMSANVYF